MTHPRRAASILLLFGLAATFAGSCAEGAPLVEGALLGGSGSISPLPGCGNGVLEEGEMCDCQGLTTGTCPIADPNITCQSMINGATGMVFCQAESCTIDTTMCMTTMPPDGGGGAGG